jgi:hypothetical protein
VTVLIHDAVTAAGYRPAGMDNEGFEAEVFFTAGSYAGGQALVRDPLTEGARASLYRTSRATWSRAA